MDGRNPTRHSFTATRGAAEHMQTHIQRQRSNRQVQTKNTHVKMVNECTDDMRKISPKTGKMLSTKT